LDYSEILSIFAQVLTENIFYEVKRQWKKTGGNPVGWPRNHIVLQVLSIGSINSHLINKKSMSNRFSDKELVEGLISNNETIIWHFFFKKCTL